MVACKTCGVEQARTKIGKRKTGSIFINEFGKEWNGLKWCPSCHRKKTLENLRKREAKKKAAVNDI